jgi:hypothetical protein
MELLSNVPISWVVPSLLVTHSIVGYGKPRPLRHEAVDPSARPSKDWR